MNCNTKLYNDLRKLDLQKSIEKIYTDIHSVEFKKFYDWEKKKELEPPLEKVLEYYDMDTASKTIQKLELANKEELKGGESVSKIISETLTEQEDTGLYKFDPDNFRQKRLEKEFGINKIIEFENSISESKPLTEEIQGYINFKNKIDKEIKSWDNLSEKGEKLHNIIELIINNKITEYKPKDYIGKKVNDVFDNDATKEATIKSLILFVNDLSKEGNLISEISLVYDGKSKVKSRLDLILVLPTGETKIIDFKFSSKSFADFDEQKDLSIQYQMVFYKHLLQNKGVDVKNIMVKPFVMSMDDNGKVNSVEEGAIEDIGVSKSLTSTSKVVKIVNSFIPSLNLSTFSDYKENEEIKNIYKEMFNIDLNRSIENVDMDIIIKDKVEKNGNKYLFLKYGSRTFSIPKLIQEDRVKVAEWIKNKHYLKIVEFENNQTLKVTTFIESYRKAVQSGSDAIPSFDSSSKGSAYIKQAVSKYARDNWEIVERPELQDLGIIMMQREMQSGIEVDFLVYTDKKFNQLDKLNKGKLLTANFELDTRVRKFDQRTDIVEATNINLQAMKVVLFVLNNNNLFTGKTKLGNIKVISKREDFMSVHFDTLKNNMNYMLEKGFIKNDKLKKATTFDYSVSQLEVYMNYLFDLINHSELQSNVTKHEKVKFKEEVSDIQSIINTHSEGETRRRLLIELLKKKNAQLISQKNINGSYKDIEDRKQKLLSNTIVYLERLGLQFDKDPKINGFVIGENINHSNPAEFTHSGVSAVVDLVNSTIVNLRSDYKDYKEEFRDLDKEFMKSVNFGKLERYTIGNKDDLYRGLVEIKDPEGNLVYRIVDPETIDNPKKKEFVKWIIETINEERTKNVSDEVKERFLNSDEARNLPLVQSSSWNKIRTKEGTYLDAMKAWFSENTERDTYFSEDLSSKNAIIEKTKMADRFSYYDSPNEDSLERRTDLLKESDGSTFESNLEIVLDSYMFNKYQKEGFDKVLYLASAINSTLAFQQEEYGIKTENAREIIKSHIETAAYNTPEMSEDSKEIEKALMAMTKGSSLLAMGLNMTTGINQLVQGLFASIVEITASRKAEDRFGFVSWGKAWKLVIGDSSMSLGTISKLDHVNELYGIANIDINYMTNKLRERYGAMALKSKWLYFSSTMPDYANRMTMLVAQMIEDGCYDAHTMVEGKMRYDMSKDYRFSVYLNDKKQHPDYHKQKALYDLMLKRFQDKDPKALKLVNDKYMFKKAYTDLQIISFKTWSDNIYGAYDHENKTKFSKMAIGKLFMQFRTWLRARMNSYYRNPTDASKIQKIVYTTQPDGTVTAEFKGLYMEGIFQTFVHMHQEIKDANGMLNKLKTIYNMEGKLNEFQRQNLKRLASELGFMALFLGASELAKMLLEHYKLESALANTLIRTVEFSAKELAITNNFKFIFDDKNFIPAFGVMNGVWETTSKILMGDKDPSELLKLSGMTRFVYYDYIKK